MKESKPSLVRALPRALLLCALLPLLLVTVLAVYLPYREMLAQRYAQYHHNMEINSNLIAAHFGCVTEAVTLMQDSLPLLQGLKDAAKTPDTPLQAADIYFSVGTPISYKNVLSNRAISAITVFSNDRLAYYSLQSTTTDLGLSRCAAIAYNYEAPPPGGGYVLPQQPNGYIYYLTSFTDIYEGKKLGEIVIEVESIPTFLQSHDQKFNEPFEYQVDLSGYPSAAYVVYDSEGTVFFSSDPAYVGTNLTYSLPKALVSGKRVATTSQNYEIYAGTLYKQHLSVALITPKSEIRAGGDDIFTGFLVLVCALGLLLLFVVLTLSGRFAAPLRALVQYCEHSREHPNLPPAFEAQFSEIETVQEAFALRAANLDEMQSVIMKNHLQMKENEIQLLQSQINPHFLFNMLDIIGWQAAQDDSKNVSEMVTHLGGLLRNNILLGNDEKISIGQEVQYIKDYLALEQIRCDNRFTYTINIDDELLTTFFIPKLSLQPIVENCVVHGFVGLERPGVIELRIWEDMDDIICTVRDNGGGFDATNYFDRATVEPASAKHSHIALRNIQDRIHMLCGAQYGIQIKSRPGKGTEVMITLPIDERK